jgi:hypothetical protein
MFASTTSTLLWFQPVCADSTPAYFMIVPPIPVGIVTPDLAFLIRDIPDAQ